MLGAGLLAQNAGKKGLTVAPYIKTSIISWKWSCNVFMPLIRGTSARFDIVGYGCMSCVGNSGPIPESVIEDIEKGDLVAVGVLSGNRNFEGRDNPHIRANYLVSPPLVIAYAIAGRVGIYLDTEPLGYGSDGRPV